MATVFTGCNNWLYWVFPTTGLAQGQDWNGHGRKVMCRGAKRCLAFSSWLFDCCMPHQKLSNNSCSYRLTSRCSFPIATSVVPMKLFHYGEPTFVSNNAPSHSYPFPLIGHPISYSMNYICTQPGIMLRCHKSRIRGRRELAWIGKFYKSCGQYLHQCETFHKSYFLSITSTIIAVES